MQFSMGYLNMRLKVRMVQHETKIWSKYKMTENGKNRFCTKMAVSVAQYFKSCRFILRSNEKFQEAKMISERRSTNAISFS
jgi:hypothetical protein